MKTTSTAV